MKNNLFRTVLTWLLATSAILSVVFCLQFIFRTRELLTLQGEIARYQSNHQMLTALVNDMMEYRSRDSAIDPILQSVGIPVGRTNAAAASALKPSGK